MKRIFVLILAVVAAQGGLAYAQTQTLTLSTYYPAPFGAYDRLRLVPRDSLTCDPNTTGLIYYDEDDGNFIFCIEGVSTGLPNIWTQNGNNIYPTDTATNSSLVVGIGTTAPASPLSVSGGISAGNYAGSAAPPNGMIISGNVGIGISNPDSPLYVVAPNTGVSIMSGNAGSHSGLTIGTNATRCRIGVAAVGGNYSDVAAAGDVVLNSLWNNLVIAIRNPNGAIKFSAGGGGDHFPGSDVLRMVITNPGNVGIGTGTPTSILHTVASGAKTADYTGNLLTNTATSATANVIKTGLSVDSTGNWTGASAVNRGLYVNVAGGTNNYAAIFNGGNVGIGTTAPAYALDVTGDARVTGTMWANLYNHSDRELKDQIAPLESSLEKVKALNGRAFVWKKTGEKDIGVIAQEVENVYPEVVAQDNEGHKGVRYMSLIAPLIEAVKELSAQVDAQKSEMEVLKGRLQALEAAGANVGAE